MKYVLAICVCLVIGCGKPDVVDKAVSRKAVAEKPLPKDFESLKALAEKGDARAQNSLGFMYLKGKGVEQDYKEAAKWTHKSAEQGLALAQHNRGWMYYNNEVQGDDVTAYAWWNIAAANGNKDAMVLKITVAENKTAEDITKAEALVKEMAAKNPKLINNK